MVDVLRGMALGRDKECPGWAGEGRPSQRLRDKETGLNWMYVSAVTGLSLMSLSASQNSSI